MTMLWGDVREQFSSPGDVDATRAHFMKLEAIARATDALDTSEDLGDGKLRMVLKEQNHGAHKVTPSYIVQYTREGDDVVWKTLEGNMVSEGRASFAPAATGTQITYQHRIELALPVGRLLAKVLQPVVKRLVESNIRDYVGKLVAGVPR